MNKLTPEKAEVLNTVVDFLFECPEQYFFHTVQIPTDETQHGCILGWIAYFAKKHGVKPDYDIDTPMWVIARDFFFEDEVPPETVVEFDFYQLMGEYYSRPRKERFLFFFTREFSRSQRGDLTWHNDARLASELLEEIVMENS